MLSTNSLDPDQARQNVWPVLDPNCYDTLGIPEFFFFEKANFEKTSTDDKKTCKITLHAKIKSKIQLTL